MPTAGAGISLQPLTRHRRYRTLCRIGEQHRITLVLRSHLFEPIHTGFRLVCQDKADALRVRHLFWVKIRSMSGRHTEVGKVEHFGQLRAALAYYRAYSREIDDLITQNENWNKESIERRYPLSCSK